jgi:hypothetical protein
MDEIEIANLVYRYAELIDAGDLVGAAGLFADARVKVFEDRPALTHEELLALWRSSIVLYPDGTPRTKHVITNPIIEVDRDGGTATCRSYYTVLQGLDDFPLQVVAAGRYHDAFVRVDGRWRYSFRDYSLHDLVGDLSRHSRHRADA